MKFLLIFTLTIFSLNAVYNYQQDLDSIKTLLDRSIVILETKQDDEFNQAVKTLLNEFKREASDVKTGEDFKNFVNNLKSFDSILNHPEVPPSLYEISRLSKDTDILNSENDQNLNILKERIVDGLKKINSTLDENYVKGQSKQYYEALKSLLSQFNEDAKSVLTNKDYYDLLDQFNEFREILSKKSETRDLMSSIETLQSSLKKSSKVFQSSDLDENIGQEDATFIRKPRKLSQAETVLRDIRNVIQASIDKMESDLANRSQMHRFEEIRYENVMAQLLSHLQDTENVKGSEAAKQKIKKIHTDLDESLKDHSEYRNVFDSIKNGYENIFESAERVIK